MVTRKDAQNAVVDWDTVNKRTEVARTYMFISPEGHTIFKQYKPSQVKAGNISSKYKGPGWRYAKMGKVDRSGKSHADRPYKEIFRERRLREMTDERNARYCY